MNADNKIKVFPTLKQNILGIGIIFSLLITLPVFVWAVVCLIINPNKIAASNGFFTSNTNKATLLFIDSSYLVPLQTELQEFTNDIKNKFGVPVKIVSLNNISTSSPDQIRQILVDECALDPTQGCKNIEGAIFVGSIPHALYEQKYDHNVIAPFMFYYQDLDSTFTKEVSGYYTGYNIIGPHPGPEIYISWIRAIQGNDYPSEINQIKNYLDKHHRFFSGQTNSFPFALAALHCPVATGSDFFIDPLKDLYRENFIEISPSTTCDDLTPKIPNLLSSLSQIPEVAYLHSHGSPETIWNLTAANFQSLPNLPLLLFSWGCANGNFYASPETNVALAFINGKDLGLTYLAKLEDSDMDTSAPNCPLCRFVNSQTYFFNYYNKGDYVGKAMQHVMSDFTNFSDPLDPNSAPEDLYSMTGGGPLQRIIIGSPFIYSPTANSAVTPTPTNTPIAGDVNGDNFVDIIDIGIIIDNYSIQPINYAGADLNNDGVVDIIDIGIVIDNYGI